MPEAQNFKTSVKSHVTASPFLCFRLPAAGSALQPPLTLRMQVSCLTPNGLVCSNIPNIPWLALCELWVLCYFLLAQTSLFFLLSTDGKRYQKIIKVLVNGRGIFSVIKWALLNGSSCLRLSGDSGRCHHQTLWVREVLRELGRGAKFLGWEFTGQRGSIATLLICTQLSRYKATLPFVLFIFILLMEPFTLN